MSYWEACDLYTSKKYSECLQLLDTLILNHGHISKYYYLRGLAKEELNDIQGAVKDYESSLQLTDNDSSTLFRYGMILKKHFNIEIGLQLLMLADKYYIGDYDIEKEIGLNRGGFLHVSRQIILNNIAAFLLEMDQASKSVEFLDRAIEIDPQYSNPYLLKGVAYQKMHRYPEAKLQYMKADELGHPSAKLALSNLV